MCFTRQPLPPGQKRQRESWELLWYWGMFGSMIFAAVGLYYKPDTRCDIVTNVVVFIDILTYSMTFRSIQNWALKEAKARMEARGEKVEYTPSSS